MNTLSNRTLLLLLPSVVLAACTGGLQPYYSTGSAPSVSGLSIDEQLGTLDGATVVVEGANFGGDRNAVTVLFGHQNATVVSAGEDTLTVIVPHGPVSGGAVDVSVGTVGGQARLEDAYTYSLPSRADGQIAYITITNDGASCYAGIYSTDIGGCEGFALSGETGIASRAEGFEATFPKAHIPFSLGKGGFAQAASLSWEEWRIITNPFDLNTADLENNTKNQRIDVGEISLTNPALEGESTCVDLSYFASYTYNGGDEWETAFEDGLLYSNTSVRGTSGTLLDEGDCSDENIASGLAREDDLGTLKLCETDEFETSNTYVYESDWLASESFFTDGASPVDLFAPVDVLLDIRNAGLEGVEITLTEAARFLDVNDSFGWVLRQSDTDISITAGECIDDDDEDRTTSAADAVFTWQWEPSAVEHSIDADEGPIKDVTTYVVANINFFAFSWLGGEGLPMQATIAVPDDNNYDDETGLSSLSLPTWVLYSMPSVNLSYGFVGTTWTGWGQPSGLNYGYYIVTLDRITEYTLTAESMQTPGGETVSGDIVLAYSTGDMGYYFFDNPLDNLDGDTCGDCIDNDGDGWSDIDDPDCLPDGPGAEVNATSDYTCNDDRDNDGDGLVDWEDPDCIDGTNGEIDDCTNGIDDDEDGWIDGDDPDCVTDIFEDSPTSSFTCNDGIDNDTDGWIDVEDPACEIGIDSESDGTSGTQCNDNLDNDGHGDIDSADLRCAFEGATFDSEEDLSGECADKLDNDADGFTDGDDPDCDIGTTEIYFSTDEFPSTAPLIALPCYNNIDDDGDGVTDAADPGCEVGGVPDGYAPDEAAADPADNDCVDNKDNDGDGWIDGADPDCSLGVDELGFGTSACNDNDDNDSDGDIDADDLGCVDGFDTDESDG